MRISDWSSDVCSSDLVLAAHEVHEGAEIDDVDDLAVVDLADFRFLDDAEDPLLGGFDLVDVGRRDLDHALVVDVDLGAGLGRSEEHTSELQSLMRTSYAVFCLKKKKNNKTMSLMSDT